MGVRLTRSPSCNTWSGGTGVVPQILRLHPANDLLSLADELIELLVGTGVQLAEPLEELVEVSDDAVPEDFRLAIILAREPLGQVRHQLGQLGGERLLGQLDTSSKRLCTRWHSCS